ncbi:hypothetical protein FA13DRAFT_758378 [Coprinellus micaceus]|uniref:Uncharacterized protein n=1 Tax=Coprinellus micaceus TaxID=71717 RepID=A0A4Y7T3P1_COPMI|nr:hypothetical protein FA13DRAFT_758378 [Coprinellus micaceus]
MVTPESQLPLAPRRIVKSVAVSRLVSVGLDLAQPMNYSGQRYWNQASNALEQMRGWPLAGIYKTRCNLSSSFQRDSSLVVDATDSIVGCLIRVLARYAMSGTSMGIVEFCNTHNRPISLVCCCSSLCRMLIKCHSTGVGTVHLEATTQLWRP